MARIDGRAKKFDGTPVDYVSIFNWVDGKCIAQLTPNSTGNWVYPYNTNSTIGVTYVADGCEPLTHGPYILTASPLENGLILNYSFNGDLQDGSIRAVDGIKTGDVSFVAGRKAGTQALRFVDGVVKTSTPLVIGSDKITISCWLKLGGFVNPQQLFFGGDIVNSIGSYYIMINNTTAPSLDLISNNRSVPSGNHASTLRRLTDANWHHFLFEIDRGSSEVSRLYLDSVKLSLEVRANYPQSGNFGDFVLNIGKDGSTHPFEGLMQDVKVYNRILTAEERTALFNE